MRADAHYVEELTGRSTEQEPRRAGRRTADASSAEDLGEHARRVLSELSSGLSTIATTASTLSADGSALTRRVQIDLLRAEAWRAAWLLRAHRLTAGTDGARLRPVALGTVLDALRDGFEPEGRLLGTTLEWRATDWHAAVAADEQALTAGISGAILATLGLTGAAGRLVRIRVDARAGELRSVEVAQEDVDPSSRGAARFFDLAYADRPGGWLAALGGHVARVACRLHRGDAVLVPSDRGTLLRLTFAAG